MNRSPIPYEDVDNIDEQFARVIQHLLLASCIDYLYEIEEEFESEFITYGYTPALMRRRRRKSKSEYDIETVADEFNDILSLLFPGLYSIYLDKVLGDTCE